MAGFGSPSNRVEVSFKNEAPSRQARKNKASRTDAGATSCANWENVTMKSDRVLLRIALLVVTLSVAAWAQDTGSITGTVKDSSGATVAGAAVVVSSIDHGINRQTD